MITLSSRYGTSSRISFGDTSSAPRPQTFAALRRRPSSCIRASVRATSMPPLSVNSPSSLYCRMLSRVKRSIITEYSTGKMKFDA